MRKSSQFRYVLIIDLVLVFNPFTSVGEILSNFQPYYAPDFRVNTVPNAQNGIIPSFSNFQQISTPVLNPFISQNLESLAFTPVPTSSAFSLSNVPPISIGIFPKQLTPANMFQPKMPNDVPLTSLVIRPDVEDEYCSTLESLEDKSKFPPAITVFKKQVALQVRKSPVLSELFNFEQGFSSYDFAWGKFFIEICISAEAGYENPSYIADLSNRNIAKTRDIVTGQDVISAYSSALGLLAYNSGLMRCENATSFAQSFLNVMEYTTNRMTIPKCPISKIAAFPVGFEDFLKSINLFKTENLPQIAQTSGEEWNYIPGGQNQVAPLAEIHPLGCSNCDSDLKPDDNLCALTSKSIQIFQNTYLRLIHSLPIFRALLTLEEFPPEDFYRTFFYGAQYLLYSLGSTKSAFYSEFISRPLKNFRALSPELIHRVRAAFMAKYLWSVKVLNEDNAQHLAEKYVNNFAENVQKIVNLQFPISKLVALTISLKSFPLQLGVLRDVNNGHNLAYLFGNEVRCHCLYQE